MREAVVLRSATCPAIWLVFEASRPMNEVKSEAVVLSVARWEAARLVFDAMTPRESPWRVAALVTPGKPRRPRMSSRV
jgi:hypothetical protein